MMNPYDPPRAVNDYMYVLDDDKSDDHTYRLKPRVEGEPAFCVLLIPAKHAARAAQIGISSGAVEGISWKGEQRETRYLMFLA